MSTFPVTGIALLILACPFALCATPEQLAAEQRLLDVMKVTADTLRPLNLETAIVADGAAQATICHAEDSAWVTAATAIQRAIAEATGVTVPLMPQSAATSESAFGRNLILLGHLDNNRLVARLYHNFFVCLDTGYTGSEGYVIQSVHEPFVPGANCVLVGGSAAEGMAAAATAFAELVKREGKPGELKLGRLLDVRVEGDGASGTFRGRMTEGEQKSAIEYGRKAMFSPGQGRSGVSQLVRHGIRAHRTGDPGALAVYKDLMHALLEYNTTDAYITGEGMARYDRDFRDSWTYEVAILWDLLEESGAFTDQERLDITNLVLKLALECVLYQGYNRPETLQKWARNEDIVHNHNTFPALGIYFAGRYFQRHYKLPAAEDWLTVAHGIFNGQKHCSKPQEDAAGYQWLPPMHTVIYSLAEGDLSFFEEGHARDTAQVAMQVMDNSGYQAAFGDHTAETASSGIEPFMKTVAWYYQDPTLLWIARRAQGEGGHPMGQDYWFDAEPATPEDHVGVLVSYLPRLCYEYAARNSQYPTAPNLPYDVTFDKLSFRDGLAGNDAYLLLDGFGRGNHMHFDANAIVRYSALGTPLLVDGEYILNAPKHHSSLVILRDGVSELTPAVTGLGRADHLDRTSYSRTWLADYNGAEWTRSIFWRKAGYFLVADRVRALEAGDFTLRCCWRPWGDAALEGNRLAVTHKPAVMTIDNLDGAPARLERIKEVSRLPVSRLSQQVSLPLRQGQTYRFLNLVQSYPEGAEGVTAKRVSNRIIVVQTPAGPEILSLAPNEADLGFSTDAEAAVLTGDTLSVLGFTELSAEALRVKATAPISLEYHPAEGALLLSTTLETEATVALAGLTAFSLDGEEQEITDGAVTLALMPGRYTAVVAPGVPLGFVEDSVARLAALLAAEPRANVAGQEQAPLNRAWTHQGFEAPPASLPVVDVKANAEHSGRYGPVSKLFDGAYTSSNDSVMWAPGVTPVITADLGQEVQISSVTTREWHMNTGWDVAGRALELSNDGFVNDVRPIEEPFAEAGTQAWGGNVNSLFTVPVNQAARYLRFTVTPARADSSVYIAEIEIRGLRPGAVPSITCITTGDLNGDGRLETIVGSDSGEIRALASDGAVLWSYTDTDGRPAINSVACGDVNGDGMDEVMYGANAARVGLLSPNGERMWTARPPEYRGIPGDVMTVLPAEVDGDGSPEVICGARNWQYFAYDEDGEMLWSHVIYAHSATVGWADDFDGDGLDEIIGGNAYYSMNLIDHDGKGLARGGSLGPEQSAAGSADVDGDGLPEVLLGTDGGELVCFDGDGKVLWRKNLGDRITRILAEDLDGDGAREIVCAAESASVFALGRDGATIWRSALPDGAQDMAAVQVGGKLHFAAAAGSAGVWLIDAGGHPVAAGQVEGRCKAVVATDNLIAVTTDKGAVEAFAVP